MEKIFILIIVGCALLLLFGSMRQRIRGRRFYIPEDSYSSSVREVNKNVTQIRPMRNGWHGGFTNITKCDTCGRTAIREEQHPVDPCPECGGKVREAGSAKWDGKNWVPPQNKS